MTNANSSLLHCRQGKRVGEGGQQVERRGEGQQRKDIYIEHLAGKLEEKDQAGRDLLEIVASEGNLSLRIFPPFSCVHLHRKYSIYRLE
jgi:hypothetical protein